MALIFEISKDKKSGNLTLSRLLCEKEDGTIKELINQEIMSKILPKSEIKECELNQYIKQLADSIDQDVLEKAKAKY